jgi:hypothetical protein
MPRISSMKLEAFFIPGVYFVGWPPRWETIPPALPTFLFSIGNNLLDSSKRPDVWWADMAWGARIFSKGRIDRAGRALLTMPPDDPAREAEVAVVDNWRACHAYPLQVIKMTLLRRAKKIDSRALIAQRLKRRPSIEIKLRDNPRMQLSQMQDLGGCRAVLSSVAHVRKLVAKRPACVRDDLAPSRSEKEKSVERIRFLRHNLCYQ